MATTSSSSSEWTWNREDSTTDESAFSSPKGLTKKNAHEVVTYKQVQTLAEIWENGLQPISTKILSFTLQFNAARLADEGIGEPLDEAPPKLGVRDARTVRRTRRVSPPAETPEPPDEPSIFGCFCFSH